MRSLSRAKLLSEMRHALQAGGIENPSLDSRVLLLWALGIDAAALAGAPEAGVDEGGAARAREFVERRLRREPVARILGEREFYGLSFALNEATLVPRPDTETIVDATLALLKDREKPWQIIDFGTGTGAIAVALLDRLPNAVAVGIDVSPRAAQLSFENARRNGVDRRFTAIVGSWGASIAGNFDLIVSNPPYIPSRDIAGLDADVRNYDPRLALDGGESGLDAYRAILADAQRLLTPDGWLVLELGIGQEHEVSALAREHLFRTVRAVRDYGGIDRVLVLNKSRLAV